MRLGVLRLEAERVEVEVARRVARAELEVVLRHCRLHPATKSAERLRHGDEEEDDRPEAARHLPKLVDGDAVDLALEEGREARLADEEAERGQHGDAAVRKLGLAVALELRGADAFREACRVEEARGLEDARERLHVVEGRRVVDRLERRRGLGGGRGLPM